MTPKEALRILMRNKLLIFSAIATLFIAALFYLVEVAEKNRDELEARQSAAERYLKEIDE